MKKLIFTSLLLVLILTGCSKKTVDITTQAPATEKNTANPETTVADLTDPANLPDTDALKTCIVETLASIGVKKIEKMEYEYLNDLISISYIITTESKKLDVYLTYLTVVRNPHWEVGLISDFDTKLYYFAPEYFADRLDLYDYQTGDLVSKQSNFSDPVDEFNEKSDQIQEDFKDDLEKIKEDYGLN